MTEVSPLAPEQLYRRVAVEELPFETTADVADVDEVPGQPRALEAIRFGVGIKNSGYNIYALGPAGTGKHSVVQRLLSQRASQQSTPSDWVYLYNFTDTQRPRAVELPPGRARELRHDMLRLVEDLQSAIPSAFESDEYRTRVQEIEQEFKDRREEAIAAIQRDARTQGVDLLRTPSGFAFAPTREGEVLSPDEYEHMPEPEKKRVALAMEGFEGKLRAVIRQIPLWRQESREKLKTLNRDVAMAATGHEIGALLEKYAAYEALIAHLNAVQEDVIENIDDFRQQEEGASPLLALTGSHSSALRRYGVNVIVEQADHQGAPVLYEDHPTYQNLVGHLEHVAMMGALVTDFSLIRGGALHRANGGYLILDAHKLLMQPFAWDGLKRVVLLGDRLLYYLLCEHDPEFADLFKVAADFEDSMDRTPDNHRLYAHFIATMARQAELRPYRREAVARVIEHAARLVGDAHKMSTHLRSIADLLRESDYYAGEAGAACVEREHVCLAISGQVHRASRIEERVRESIRRGTTLIDTDGLAVGQVNGLSVLQLGGYSFGAPHRITARVRLGEGEVIDIEREVELGGPIHSKGVLILSGWLGSRYAADVALSLSATLVFEQSYGEVEGDSASSAELYALLSALADAPIKQSLAVTGSINQQGQVQAIGGVNEKIEGYFDVCRMRGLSGHQGVLIPAANMQHLMLREDVIEAVQQGKFLIFPVETVDQGIALLTGMAAGETDAEGQFSDGSVNARVQTRLRELAQLRQAFAEHAKDKETP